MSANAQGIHRPALERRKAFYRQFAKQGFVNATQAVLTNTPNLTNGSARVQAHRMLTDTNAIEAQAEELAKIMSPEEVQEQITEIARNKDKDNRPYRVRTLELMARVHALLIDKSQVETKDVRAEQEEIDRKAAELAIKLIRESVEVTKV